jgi:LemA protein
MILLAWILIALAVILVIIFISYFNRFAVLSNRIDNSLSQIDVQLKRRADLIPNLIESVKGYMKHEKAAIEAVTSARKAMLGAKDLPGKIKANDSLGAALKTVFAIAESYPDLKANTTFLKLQEELTTTEDKIAYSRQFYNDSILSYNNLCTTFPGKFFAGMYGRKQKEYIKIQPEERKAVKVEF